MYLDDFFKSYEPIDRYSSTTAAEKIAARA
jgi:hypothetical protein